MLEKIRARDGDLAAQIRTAAQSMALNLEEGAWKGGRDRLNRYRIAAGSAAESRAGLRVAAAFGYVADGEIAACVGQIDQVLAILAKILGFEGRQKTEAREKREVEKGGGGEEEGEEGRSS